MGEVDQSTYDESAAVVDDEDRAPTPKPKSKREGAKGREGQLLGRADSLASGN